GESSIVTVGITERSVLPNQCALFFWILTKPAQTYSHWIYIKSIYTSGALWKDPHCVDPTPPTPTPTATCQDSNATNFGGPLPCAYGEPSPPPPQLPTPTCQDREASNFGGPLPCTYDVPAPPENVGWCHVAQNEHDLAVPTKAIQ